MSPSKFSGVTLRDGDQVRILMPGGGGYGDPPRRDPERVRRDVDEGFVSAEAARDGLRARGRGGTRWVSGSAPRSLPEGEPGRLRALRAPDRAPLLGAPTSTAAERMFCSPEHEQLYHDYWLPRYGAKEAG